MVDRPDGQSAHIRYHMQLNKSFLAIGYRLTDRQTDRRTDGITDICDSRVAFTTEKSFRSIMNTGFRGKDLPWSTQKNFPRRCTGFKTMKIGNFEACFGPS